MIPALLKYLERWIYPSLVDVIVLISCISILLILSTAAVYYSGGTYYAYIHLFYIPIILAGFLFSVQGGGIVGLLAGLINGPFMPGDVETATMQPTYSWLMRLFLFVFIGILAGLSSAIFKEYMKEIKLKFTTNPLTNLPNYLGMRAAFIEISRRLSHIGLIVIEIRNTNEIELAIGPSGMQHLMRKVAARLRKHLPEFVTLGHPHGSSFILLIEEVGRLEDVLKDCERNLRSSYVVDGIPVFVEKYFGISQYPEDDRTFTGLVRKARTAITYATKQVKNVARYTQEMFDESADNAVILTDLSRAIEEGTLDVYYQPKLDLKTGKVVGVEALSRWHHPTKGDIPPATFIPLTERTLLINPFTKWILHQTLKDLSSWNAEGFDISLAINFSMRNFHDFSTITRLFKLIEEYNIKPNQVEIEITESAFSSDLKDVIQASQYIRDRGVKVSIDDFGTGLASQQYLFELPIDALKIDRIFVSELGKKPAAEAIVQSAISLGHQLGLQIVGEGIESEEQLAILQRLECDYGQGFLFAEPMPSFKLMKWLRGPQPLREKFQPRVVQS